LGLDRRAEILYNRLNFSEFREIETKGDLMRQRYELLSGFQGFTLIWLGQVISLLGTGMTRFALTIWAYQETGSATALALVALASFGPTVLLSPVAGALVDRWNRKLVVMLSDLGAGMATIFLLLLYATGNLEVWHLYAAGAFASTFESFQFPAFSAAVTMMVPKEHFARASGMQSLAESVGAIAAPILAGILLVTIGIGGILVIDVISFSLAVAVVIFVFIPQPQTTDVGETAQGSLWAESLFGFRYILSRPSLLGMQLIFFQSNLFGSFGWVLLPALILARTANNELMLGTVQSVLGVGGLLGGLAMSVWGGPKNKVHGVLLGMFFQGLLGTMIMGIARGLPLWVVGGFFSMFFIPVLNGSNQAIWQAKVAPDVQGRVFAARRLIAQITAPVAMVLAGPLADRLFEPGMQGEGWLADTFGLLVGTGPGAGIALIFFLTGLVGAIVPLAGYLIAPIRDIDTLLPDYVAIPQPPEPASVVELANA
jgi:DHA3 family macrolide efflux protein-like MFS transporter